MANHSEQEHESSSDNSDNTAPVIIENDLPSLQTLQQNVLDSRSERTRMLILYAIGAAVLLGLSKKIVIPPFNAVIDIGLKEFGILGIIMCCAALYLIWELLSGVRSSVQTWRLNRDLSYQQFRHHCLSRVSDLETRVASKFTHLIDFRKNRIRGNLTESRNTILTRLSQLAERREQLLADERQVLSELRRQDNTSTVLFDESDAPDTDSHDRSSHTSAKHQFGKERHWQEQLRLIRSELTALEQEERSLLAEKNLLDAQVVADEDIAEKARHESIPELNSLFSDAIDELTREYRDRQLAQDGSAAHYSLMLGIQRKNNDYQTLQNSEHSIVRRKGYTPAGVSVVMLLAALALPIFTFSQQWICENSELRTDCPLIEKYPLKTVIADISSNIDGLVNLVLAQTTDVQSKRTDVFTSLLNSPALNEPRAPMVSTSSNDAGGASSFFVGKNSDGLLRLSYPVFDQSSDSIPQSRLEWLTGSAQQLVSSLDSCGDKAWLHIVGFADSRSYNAPYPACDGLAEGDAIDMGHRRNLCLANQRAVSVADVFTRIRDDINSPVRITTRQWQGVQCTSSDCYSEYDMMIHQAGIVDAANENTGWMNRRADVHIMSAGRCDPHSVVQ